MVPLRQHRAPRLGWPVEHYFPPALTPAASHPTQQHFRIRIRHGRLRRRRHRARADLVRQRVLLRAKRLDVGEVVLVRRDAVPRVALEASPLENPSTHMGGRR